MRQPWRMRALLVLFLTCLISACVTIPKLPASADGELISVTYEPGGPICAPCDSLEIVTTSDGRAIWTHGHGTYREFVRDRHSLKFSPAQFQRWRARLAEFRPQGNLYFSANSETKTCDVAYFDMPSRMIEWQDHQRTDRLVLDLGCDPEKHVKLLQFLDQFPSLMGINNPPKADQWVATTRAP